MDPSSVAASAPFSYGVLSLLPPLLAIGLALLTRQVVLSLLGGVWLGWALLSGYTAEGFSLGGFVGGGTAATIKALVDVFGEAWQTRVILFTLLMGSLLMLMQRSGGVEGFVLWVSRWRWSNSRAGAQLMAWFIGLGVFIESTITCLMVGTVSRPLFDRLRISREKLAYICDSTSAPVCMMLPINGWGATVLGLLYAQHTAGYLGTHGALPVFLAAIPLNFYAILSILLVLMVAVTGWDFGPMREAERRAREEGKLLRDGAMPVVDTDVVATTTKPGLTPAAHNMVLPLMAMVLMVPVGIYITGAPGWAGAPADATISERLQALLNEASGSLSVLWGVILGVAVAGVLYYAQRMFSVQETVDLAFKGAGGLVPLAAIMVFAFAIGMVCNKLGTGPYVASALGEAIPAWSAAPLVFLTACFISFATGTSWGTFTIMIPLAMPLGAELGVPPALMLSAVLGGGVFGDHCSPISDTTLVSSMAACCDHIDHVRTQLPYALAAGAATALLYVLIGLWML